jgi:hypothetical protein
MEFTAYICDDFTFDTRSQRLTITGVLAKYTANNKMMVQRFIENSFENAVVCPQLFVDGDTLKTASIVVFD